MSWFPRPVGPRAAFADLAAFMRQRSREQVIGAALALLATIILVILFMVDSQINTAPPAQIIYAENWRADRTDAEIIADQKKDQEIKREYQAKKRAEFQQLQNSLGIE
ncbi:hypothetical protein H8M03_08885 [Sphingomonas sabuli]|uniref:Uncharacterized protein n=1 Tax=Sphingomonas sabuli TaxID=2764186 RepID=A0A7G9L0J0_9SPHN|nr:hypothetical protein [Sphingomonas sabuli]QNM82139.1 hypothetical protein H8M03_08885 [Sphingomonas sabuli]